MKILIDILIIMLIIGAGLSIMIAFKLLKMFKNEQIEDRKFNEEFEKSKREMDREFEEMKHSNQKMNDCDNEIKGFRR